MTSARPKIAVVLRMLFRSIAHTDRGAAHDLAPMCLWRVGRVGWPSNPPLEPNANSAKAMDGRSRPSFTSRFGHGWPISTGRQVRFWPRRPREPRFRPSRKAIDGRSRRCTRVEIGLRGRFQPRPRSDFGHRWPPIDPAMVPARPPMAFAKERGPPPEAMDADRVAARSSCAGVRRPPGIRRASTEHPPGERDSLWRAPVRSQPRTPLDHTPLSSCEW